MPLVIVNDGDVTALAGSMSLEDHSVLGIALGSSEAAGYVNAEGNITGWLNELAFAPVDYQPDAPVDEWSGDRGVGAQYFSQQCVFRLAPRAGIAVPADAQPAEKLKVVQARLEAGDEAAASIWQTMGVYLGYTVAHYADFYDLKHVLILGRCTSGRGGDILLTEARKVLSSEFPELARNASTSAARREEPPRRPVGGRRQPAGPRGRTSMTLQPAHRRDLRARRPAARRGPRPHHPPRDRRPPGRPGDHGRRRHPAVLPAAPTAGSPAWSSPTAPDRRATISTRNTPTR